MARNYIQKGNTLDFTAPSGGVTAGNGYMFGDLFIIALSTERAGRSFSAQCAGVFELPKRTADTFAEGSNVYWDTSNGEAIVTQASSEPLIGHATTATDSGAETVVVRLIPEYEEYTMSEGIHV